MCATPVYKPALVRGHLRKLMTEEGQEDQARWQRMEEIYHAALPLPFPERPAFVEQRCAGDAALREEVFSLLASDESAEDFLQEPVVGLGMAVLADEAARETEILSQPLRPAASDLLDRVVAGRYEVIKRLGGGGFGDLYKAADTKIMSRPVVIKVLKDEVLRAESATRDWVVTKFKQEIEALARIEDSGVVRILDADSLPDGRPYIVMEFVEGSDLRRFVEEARRGHVTEQGLCLQDVAEIVRQVGRTLTAAHEKEIFHRDLKPENIMLRRNASGDLQVKVIDFGIAKVRNSLVATSTATGLFVAGTWQYMAPEQLLGKKVDAACDIYALGVIAYELVTGRCPFPAKDVVKLKEMQQAGVKIKPCDLNPELTAAAQDAILKALEYYPAERRKRARDFGDELARALVSAEELVRHARPAAVNLEVETLKDIAEDVREEDGRRSVVPLPVAPPARPRSPWRWLAVASVVLLAGVIGFLAWRSRVAGPERTLAYWLSVQRPRDKEPFDSTGNVVYDAGSKFWLNVQTTQDGALYLFAEGHDGEQQSELNTLFPTPVSGKGDARIAAGATRRVNEKPNVFRNGSGVIYLWVIWSTQPVPILDEIVKNSYQTQGVILDPSRQAALRDYIKQHSEPKAEVVEDELRSRVTVSGHNEVLVDVRKLKYQP
jgi:serine/threonine protein kinase